MIFFKILIFLTFFTRIESLQRRDEPLQLKTSVIIPCHGKHLAHIPSLLVCLAEQTVPPDEVVICFTKGQVKNPPQSFGKFPFEVRLVPTDRSYPCHARNAACVESSGDLLICQDADDVPHPRRIEIIRHLFEKFSVDILLHRWSPSPVVFETYSAEESEGLAYELQRYSEVDALFDFVHNGSPAFLKKVVERVQWPPTPLREDILFNAEAFRLFKYKVLLDERLVIYRPELSSYRDRYKRDRAG